MLISDGHADDGVTDPAQLGAVAAGAAEHGVTTATVGLGLGHDERLLTELARGGRGDHEFAEGPDDAAAVVAGQVEGLLSKTVQAASLTVRPTGDVASVNVHDDLPGQVVGDALVLELGDLWAGEERKLVLTLGVPAMASLGLAQDAKRRAAEALDAGDVVAARRTYDQMLDVLACAPPSADLDDERLVLGELSDRVDQEAAWAAKRSRAEHARKSRKRGR